jgi:hypothetical protein
MHVLAVAGFPTALSGWVARNVGPGTTGAALANAGPYWQTPGTRTGNGGAVIGIANPVDGSSTAEWARGWMRAPLIDWDKS